MRIGTAPAVPMSFQGKSSEERIGDPCTQSDGGIRRSEFGCAFITRFAFIRIGIVACRRSADAHLDGQVSATSNRLPIHSFHLEFCLPDDSERGPRQAVITGPRDEFRAVENPEIRDAGIGDIPSRTDFEMDYRRPARSYPPFHS